RDRHGSPFEHNAFRFHIRCPIFVAREWMRHRVGCLTGDTVVTFVDTKGHAAKHLAKTVDELWQDRRGGVPHAESSLRVFDDENRVFTTGQLDDIIDKGVQPVYEVTLTDGKHLKLTENHRILTASGGKRMRAAVRP